MSIAEDIQKLDPGALVEFFEIDATPKGGLVYRFHAGTNQLNGTVVWQGESYTAWPVEADGFEFSSKGTLPRPKLMIANVTAYISALVINYSDLLGCKVTRRRTFVKYLDAVNFPGGTNPTADANAAFADDVYYIDRKSKETKLVVEFELASAMDVYGVQLPRRQIIQNVCPWRYRGSECGYTGTNYFDASDNTVASSGQDVCGKRLSSCKKRFGEYAELPFGGFPAAGLFR